MFLDNLASYLWNPFLCLLYIELGLLFLWLTGGVALKKTYPYFKKLLQERSGDGEHTISHRKAFFSSLATTVGVGNLAGVGTAIHLGGPGALFWMWVSAIFGMSFRMVTTYMAIKNNPDDVSSPIFGTPMNYLKKYCTGAFKFVAPLMAGTIIFKGMVAANLIQANSVAHALHSELGLPSVLIASILAIAVGLVVIGGFKVIVDVTSSLAPWMVILYSLTGLLILILNPAETVASLFKVFHYAFTPHAAIGGAAGYTIMQALQFGTARGVFSHASGIGVAPFLQGANKAHPAQGAFMAAMTPVADTLLVCTITGLVVISGDYWPKLTGAYLTTHTFYQELGMFGYLVVTISLIIFAFTTIIGWYLYTSKCYNFLSGKYKGFFGYVFVSVTFLGPFLPVRAVWSLGDLLVGSLLIVNLIPLTFILIKEYKTTNKDLVSNEI
jgi:alanine or glycine:cation symporter, AGCS family